MEGRLGGGGSAESGGKGKEGDFLLFFGVKRGWRDTLNSKVD